MEKWLIPRAEKSKRSACCRVPEKLSLQYIRNNTNDVIFKLILFLGCVVIFVARARQGWKKEIVI